MAPAEPRVDRARAAARRLLGTLLIAALAGGCATDVPRAVREAPAQSLRVAQVQAAADAYLGRTVRWGGEVVSVSNRPAHTDVEILARRLYTDGEPVPDSQADARFLARVDGFIDPAELKPGQRMTVSGSIIGTWTGTVGEYAYTYPLVRVQSYYRWPEPAPVAYPPRYYDPFYDPWWPHYGPWPWWQRPYGW